MHTSTTYQAYCLASKIVVGQSSIKFIWLIFKNSDSTNAIIAKEWQFLKIGIISMLRKPNSDDF